MKGCIKLVIGVTGVGTIGVLSARPQASLLFDERLYQMSDRGHRRWDVRRLRRQATGPLPRGGHPCPGPHPRTPQWSQTTAATTYAARAASLAAERASPPTSSPLVDHKEAASSGTRAITASAPTSALPPHWQRPAWQLCAHRRERGDGGDAPGSPRATATGSPRATATPITAVTA